MIVCVADQDAAREVLGFAADALQGRALVNITSGTPAQGREIAELAASHGAAALDGVALAVPRTVGTADAALLYAGSEAAFTEHRAVLERLGAATFVGADPGLAAVYDMALLCGMYGTFAGFFHGVAMGGAEGVDVVRIAGPMADWIRATSARLPELAARIDAAGRTGTGHAAGHTADASSLDISSWGLTHILDTAAGQGLDPGLLAPLRDFIDRQIAAGHGSDGLSRVIDSVRRTA